MAFNYDSVNNMHSMFINIANPNVGHKFGFGEDTFYSKGNTIPNPSSWGNVMDEDYNYIKSLKEMKDPEVNFADKLKSGLGVAGTAMNLIGSGIDLGQGRADISGFQAQANNLSNTRFAGTNESLIAQRDATQDISRKSYSDIGGISNGEIAMTTVGNTAKGAMAGAQVGGPIGAIVGGAVGLGSGIIGGIFGHNKDKAKQRRLNAQIRDANLQAQSNFRNAVDFNNRQSHKASMLNIRALGGDLESNDTTFNPYLTIFNEGGSHEENPLGGIPQGIAADGTPNLVEEGEVKWNDYIFSRRLTMPDIDIDMYKIPKRFKGKSYADIAKSLYKEKADRPVDSISDRTLEVNLAKLQQSQEMLKALREEQEAAEGVQYALGGLLGISEEDNEEEEKKPKYRGTHRNSLGQWLYAGPVLNGIYKGYNQPHQGERFGVGAGIDEDLLLKNYYEFNEDKRGYEIPNAFYGDIVGGPKGTLYGQGNVGISPKELKKLGYKKGIGRDNKYYWTDNKDAMFRAYMDSADEADRTALEGAYKRALGTALVGTVGGLGLAAAPYVAPYVGTAASRILGTPAMWRKGIETAMPLVNSYLAADGIKTMLDPSASDIEKAMAFPFLGNIVRAGKGANIVSKNLRDYYIKSTGKYSIGGVEYATKAEAMEALPKYLEKKAAENTAANAANTAAQGAVSSGEQAAASTAAKSNIPRNGMFIPGARQVGKIGDELAGFFSMEKKLQNAQRGYSSGSKYGFKNPKRNPDAGKYKKARNEVAEKLAEDTKIVDGEYKFITKAREELADARKKLDSVKSIAEKRELKAKIKNLKNTIKNPDTYIAEQLAKPKKDFPKFSQRYPVLSDILKDAPGVAALVGGTTFGIRSLLGIGKSDDNNNQSTTDNELNNSGADTLSVPKINSELYLDSLRNAAENIPNDNVEIIPTIDTTKAEVPVDTVINNAKQEPLSSTRKVSKKKAAYTAVPEWQGFALGGHLFDGTNEPTQYLFPEYTYTADDLVWHSPIYTEDTPWAYTADSNNDLYKIMQSKYNTRDVENQKLYQAFIQAMNNDDTIYNKWVNDYVAGLPEHKRAGARQKLTINSDGSNRDSVLDYVKNHITLDGKAGLGHNIEVGRKYYQTMPDGSRRYVPAEYLQYYNVGDGEQNGIWTEYSVTPTEEGKVFLDSLRKQSSPEQPAVEQPVTKAAVDTQPAVDISSSSSNDNTRNNNPENYDPNKVPGSKYASLLRYAPILNDTYGYLSELLSPPDYSNAELLRPSRTNVGWHPIGNYQRYKPVDTNYYLSKLENNRLASQSLLGNSTNGNAAAYQAAMLQNNARYGESAAKVIQAAEDENYNRYNKVTEFNRGTDATNQDADIKVQGQRLQAEQMYQDALARYAAARQKARDAKDTNKMYWLTQLSSDLGAAGKENISRNLANSLSALGYYADDNGFIHYQNKDDKDKEKKACGGYLTIKTRRR